MNKIVKNFSSHDDAEKWIADMFDDIRAAADKNYQNQLGASQKSPQPVPNPALAPGTIITERCFIVDNNHQIWLMDPEEGTIEYFELNDD